MGILDPTPSAILLPLWTVLQKYTLFGLTLDEIIYIPRPAIFSQPGREEEGGSGLAFTPSTPQPSQKQMPLKI